MTADELRELADKLVDPSDTLFKFHMDQAAAYLRACADAMDAGPVATAWMLRGELVNAFPRPPGNESDLRYWIDKGYSEAPLYPVAMPAQAQPLRLPEPMTDEEVAALIAETEYLPTDHAVRYLVETGECRVKEANE